MRELLINYRHGERVIGKVQLEEEIIDLLKLKHNLDVIYCLSYIEDGTLVPSGFRKG